MSATAQSTNDGQIKLSSPAPTATSPNTDGVNSDIAALRLVQSHVFNPVPQAMPTADCSITWWRR